MGTTRWEVRRDGTRLVTTDSEAAAWRWLLDHQSSSVLHATTHEGYAIVPRRAPSAHEVGQA